ncbi:SMP-30/gluconolactonase/LRE family protein [Flavobacterium cellulosilyticum]|uniref:SMP-30/gluconolactonase/LRE family protein n=2 Tax=Flavobacterium cellulosilyticum TaxID=2541731 RepID=A0A4R5CMG6_9FLAO|nr:SMP-30/gluconolactonase/LRE family protein [Flavobacterium cellulosilyticum]TDD99880.1 SMP-30/gluconolactonase/LRE family protein [Flavobacterium cellulosilyticum]
MKTITNKQSSNHCLHLIGISLLMIVNISCKAQKNKNSAIIADGAQLTLVADGFEFTEGPAADKNGDVYFTDQPNDRILKWNALDNTVLEYMKPSGRSNGLYFDNQGNLLAVADEKNEIWRIDVDKKVTVLLTNFEGKKFNGPNDLWVDSKGGIYFTDPYYQRSWWKHQEPQQKSKRVYYLAPNADKPKIVADDHFDQPNGIIGTPNGKTLYVADQAGNKTYSYTIGKKGKLSNKKLFANMGSDGMTIDHLGNVYLTGNGVTVFNKEGQQIEHIAVPENWTANITFGGPNQTTLFITAMDSVYTLDMAVHGVR